MIQYQCLSTAIMLHQYLLCTGAGYAAVLHLCWRAAHHNVLMLPLVQPCPGQAVQRPCITCCMQPHHAILVWGPVMYRWRLPAMANQCAACHLLMPGTPNPGARCLPESAAAACSLLAHGSHSGACCLLFCAAAACSLLVPGQQLQVTAARLSCSRPPMSSRGCPLQPAASCPDVLAISGAGSIPLHAAWGCDGSYNVAPAPISECLLSHAGTPETTTASKPSSDNRSKATCHV